MTVLPLRRRTVAALALGALVLAGVSACGSSSATTAGDGTSPVSATTSGTTSDAPSESQPATAGSSTASTPAAGATASTSSDGAAPASVSIESPRDGTTVGSTLSVQGTANSPEANVPWEVDSPIDGVVVSGSATADGWLDKAYPWKTEVDVSALQPGTYTFTARVDDDSNKEGTKPPEATITFTKK